MNPAKTEADLWVVIPAAGIGARMAADRPKQYLMLGGRTVLEHTLACFADHPRVRGIVLAIALDDPFWPDLMLDVELPVHVVPGGDERSGSVLNALDLLAALGQPSDWVLVHDAARPNLAREDLDRLVAEVEQDAVGGILAVPVRDTMKRADGEGRIARTEPRDGLWHALTPQMFRLGLLRESLRQALEEGVQVTDEASALEQAGLRPLLVEGRADNIKITRPEDLSLAEFFLMRGRA
ncbi:MAG: 2-C-methyl-D-erythritol 4-phosphate cytidylyltransferase [Pseudomonadota bacterium]